MPGQKPVLLPPSNLLASDHPIDIANNVRSVLTFLSWANIDRNGSPASSDFQFGYSLIIETLIGAMEHLENLLKQREVAP